MADRNIKNIMTTSFLALKGVNSTYNSAFVTNPLLVRHYPIGATVTAPHIELPLWLASLDDVTTKGDDIMTGAATTHILLVEVEENNLTNKVAFGDLEISQPEHLIHRNLQDILDHVSMRPERQRFYLGTSQLRVLAEMPEDVNLFRWLCNQSAMYGLPILSAAQWLNNR